MKFRVFSKKQKQYFVLGQIGDYSHELVFSPQPSVITRFLGEFDSRETDIIIEESTGRFDGEGKEIYEGDILKTTYNSHIFENGERNWSDVSRIVVKKDYHMQLQAQSHGCWYEELNHLTRKGNYCLIIGNVNLKKKTRKKKNK